MARNSHNTLLVKHEYCYNNNDDVVHQLCVLLFCVQTFPLVVEWGLFTVVMLNKESFTVVCY